MEFLNHRIHPLVPMYSSVGETDINLLAHIGAAMIGQGEVQFRGAKISANAALKKARLKPIRLGGKDALSISSSNAFSVGSVALTLNEASSLLILADQIFALHLEAFEAAASILMQPGTKRAHEDIHYRKCIDRLCKYLHGSFLWKSSSLRLQEPLSFRITTSIHSAAHRIVSHLTKELELKLNSSSDNPAVFTDKQSTKSNLKSATIIQTGNFELSEVTILVESLCAAIARVASVCCERMARLAELGGRTGQFFANDQMPFGLIGLNRVCVCLNAELQQAAIPSSGLATFVNQTEDLVSNAPLAIMRLSRISDRFAAILAVALFQAAHAIEMRSVSRPGDRLGAGTGKLFHRFRLEVPVLQRHFPLTPSLESSLAFIRKLVLSEVSEVQDGC
jgi:histidine ammonia-lyase